MTESFINRSLSMKIDISGSALVHVVPPLLVCLSVSSRLFISQTCQQHKPTVRCAHAAHMRGVNEIGPQVLFRQLYTAPSVERRTNQLKCVRRTTARRRLCKWHSVIYTSFILAIVASRTSERGSWLMDNLLTGLPVVAIITRQVIKKLSVCRL